MALQKIFSNLSVSLSLLLEVVHMTYIVIHVCFASMFSSLETSLLILEMCESGAWLVHFNDSLGG